MRESVSAPITSARRTSPARTYLSAIDSAYMKPAQAVSTLKAGTPRQPRRCCSSTPQLGKIRSGVVVPKAMKSTSSGGDAGRLERAPCGDFRQVDRRFVLRRDVAALDAGTGADPLIGGVDHFLEIVIGHDPIGQARAGAADARVNQ